MVEVSEPLNAGPSARTQRAGRGPFSPVAPIRGSFNQGWRQDH